MGSSSLSSRAATASVALLALAALAMPVSAASQAALEAKPRRLIAHRRASQDQAQATGAAAAQAAGATAAAAPASDGESAPTVRRKLWEQIAARHPEGGPAHARTLLRTGSRAMEVHELLPGETVEEGKARLLLDPDVEHVEEDEILHVAASLERRGRRTQSASSSSTVSAASSTKTPDDPQFSSQWGYGAINAEAAWAISTGGPVGEAASSTPIVCVIDSGIDVWHEDLHANLASNYGTNMIGVASTASSDSDSGNSAILRAVAVERADRKLAQTPEQSEEALISETVSVGGVELESWSGSDLSAGRKTQESADTVAPSVLDGDGTGTVAPAAMVASQSIESFSDEDEEEETELEAEGESFDEAPAPAPNADAPEFPPWSLSSLAEVFSSASPGSNAAIALANLKSAIAAYGPSATPLESPLPVPPPPSPESPSPVPPPPSPESPSPAYSPSPVSSSSPEYSPSPVSSSSPAYSPSPVSSSSPEYSPLPSPSPSPSPSDSPSPAYSPSPSPSPSTKTTTNTYPVGTSDLTDGLEHGTHVAGIVAAVGDNDVDVTGVAWGGVRLLACKFLDSDGIGYTSDAVACVRYCLGNGARVLSNSWGGSSVRSEAMATVIQEASGAGALFVAAAGNMAENVTNTTSYPAWYGRDSDNVLAVAAVNKDGSLASESNYGTSDVQVAAPGTAVLSTLPGNQTGYLSGTSMATPFVSGVAALILGAAGSNADSITATQLREVIVDSALMTEDLSGKVGYGMLQADAALQLAIDRGYIPASSSSASSGRRLLAGDRVRR